jgi:hypothetical protein
MTNQLFAIVSDNIRPDILEKIQEKCGTVMTSSEVAQLEDEQYGVLLQYIEAQKLAKVETPMRAIRQNALEIHGAQLQPDGSVKTAYSINLSILFKIDGLRTDLETGETSEALNRYARGVVMVQPTYKSGATNSLYAHVASYASALQRNPKAVFNTNGSVQLMAGSGITQKKIVCNQPDSYVIFSIAQGEVEIGDGTNYMVQTIDVRNCVLMDKTGSSNVIEQVEYDFDSLPETVPTNVPAQAPMVIPTATGDRRVPAVSAAKPAMPRRQATQLFNINS